MDNIRKLTIPEFRKIKAELNDVLAILRDYYIRHKDDSTFDEKAFDLGVANNYQARFMRLLSYDLSLIPFEEWQDVVVSFDNAEIDSNLKLDFSKTHANIDMEIFEYLGGINLRGCNIKNLSYVSKYIREEDFDEETKKQNSELFLNDIVPADIKAKYHKEELTIADIAKLPKEVIEELKTKDLDGHCRYAYLGFDKLIELYNYSPSTLDLAIYVLTNPPYDTMHDNFANQFQNTNVENIKALCYEYEKAVITNGHGVIDPTSMPPLFVQENADFLLTGENIPPELRERYYHRNLTVTDITTYHHLFQDIPLLTFCSEPLPLLIRRFEPSAFYEIIAKHPQFLEHIVESSDSFTLSSYLGPNNNTMDNFIEAAKLYVVNDYINSTYRFREMIDGVMQYIIPPWLESLDFHFTEDVHSGEELLNYDAHTVILNQSIQNTISTLGIENIRRFNSETGFFTHKSQEYSSGLEMINVLATLLYYREVYDSGERINFRHGTLPYDKFKDELAKTLDIMRAKHYYIDQPNYDFLDGAFRSEHPEIFIDQSAPEELRKLFYEGKITPLYVSMHPEIIPLLIDKNLSYTINADLRLGTMINKNTFKTLNFIREYSKRYGNAAMLELIVKYGEQFNELLSIMNANNEIDSKELIEKQIMKAIYDRIINFGTNYFSLDNNLEFKTNYPDLFLSLEELADIPNKHYIRSAFYMHSLNYEDIRKNPKLVDVLKYKNLRVIFKKRDTNYQPSVFRDDELIDAIGNEQFLELCRRYGKYMDNYANLVSGRIFIKDNKLYYRGSNLETSFEGLAESIEDAIYKEIVSGTLAYDEDAPEFLKTKHAELFLDKNAPAKLKDYFYRTSHGLDFMLLRNFPEWLPYLKKESLKPSLIRASGPSTALYFELFGYQKGLELGVQRAETVTSMISKDLVPLMKVWYDKTGRRFIPDFAVMENIPIDEADKFLTSGRAWADFMKITPFARNLFPRRAMLKIAYSFGAFDGDARGTKKIMELLSAPPHKIPANCGFEEAIRDINNYIANTYSDDMDYEHPDYETRLISELADAIWAEDVGIDLLDGGFGKIYRKTEEGYYVLTIDDQRYPKTARAIRNVLNEIDELPIITPEKASHHFSKFAMEYNPDFREFFLDNYELILSNEVYLGNLAEIQKRFKEIKSIYRNVPITFELAYKYVCDNRYENVNIGNQELERVVGIPYPPYSQEDFDTLQQIYNYGKQRVVSSIPKVSGEVGEYVYEMIDLTDPRAIIIGYLTDCCQRLGHAGELCMEHSMVDKHGRLFVIRDKNDPEGIIAQSWVWRNQDVICFDNIEVPDRQMWSHGIQRGREDDGIRNNFTDELLNIYRKAASELMEKDEAMYHSLYESGQITESEYEGLRLRKVTTGLGHSNISGSLRTLERDRKIARPLVFTPPVPLLDDLYINDSRTQFILEKQAKENTYNGETLTPYTDEYNTYDDKNFPRGGLEHLGRLEIATDENEQKFIRTNYLYMPEGGIVSEVGIRCHLNPDTTKVVMHPNFAIVYDASKDKIRLGSLLYNTKIDNFEQQIDIEKPVLMQMYLAIKQISKNKEIDITHLNDREKAMYERIMNIKEELDKERGVHHGR